MKGILAIMLLSAMLTGSVFQTYGQTARNDGSSTITKGFDIGIFSGMLGEDANAKIAQACASNPSLACNVSGGVIMITGQFSASEGYYEFHANYGIPYIDYELAIKKVPTDRFARMLDNAMLSAGLINATSDDYGDPLDLQDESTNREAAEVLGQGGMDI
ncbi:hypothetical protein H0O02_04990, partial [Candidatus Micrarchaeota archaeon]|nr:hypothetical protein [Candidatus Micrarchaeota archaeon]